MAGEGPGLPRLFWALLAATLALYAAIVGWSLPYIAAEAGGLTPFDLRPAGYDTEAARAFLSALSPEGRAQYLGPQHAMDTAYPAMLALVLVLAARRVVPRRWQGAVVALALVGMLGDYLENMRVAGLLALPPAEVSAEAVAAASTATLVKSLAGGLAMAIVLAAALAAALRRWRGRA